MSIFGIWDSHKNSFPFPNFPGIVGIMPKLKFSFPFPKFPGIVGMGIPKKSLSRNISAHKIDLKIYRQVRPPSWAEVALGWDFFGIPIPKSRGFGIFFPRKIPKQKSRKIPNPRDWDFFWANPKISKIPGSHTFWDPTLFGKNPMGFKIPRDWDFFFVGLGISHEKATSAHEALRIDFFNCS